MGSRGRKRKGRAIDGIIILDKPQGLSSNGALQRVKRYYHAAKAGHTGSLDPLATGVLPLCLGEATKVSQFLLESDKRYQAEIKLGERTDSGDSEGNVIKSVELFDGGPADKQIKKALDDFRGDIEQVPPMYSALKVQGVPLYKMARKGLEVERQPRAVTIYEIELLRRESQFLTIDVHCSKGTYIRSIADDLGESLGCGAHITALRRTQSGCFALEESITLDELEVMAEQVSDAEADHSELDSLLHSADQAIDYLPEVLLADLAAESIQQGQSVWVSQAPAEGLVRLYEEYSDEESDVSQRFIGIGIIDDDGKVAPKRLFKQN